MLRTVSLFLVVALVTSSVPSRAESLSRPVTLEDLRARYPNAKFVEVSPAEFERSRTSYSGRSLVLVELSTNAVRPGVSSGELDASPTNAPPAETLVPRKPASKTVSESSPRQPKRSDNYSQGDVGIQFYGSGNGGLSDDNFAVIVFVLIGVVVVAAQILYVGDFLYDVLVKGEKYEYWWENNLQTDLLAGSDRSGGMYGFRLAGGFLREDMQIGLAAEGGYMAAAVKVENRPDPVDIGGAYGLLGPCVQWAWDDGPNPSGLLVELLTGTANDTDVGLISKARVGVLWGVGRRLRLGLSIGSLYMKIKETDGPLKTDSDFNLILGVTAGVRF